MLRNSTIGAIAVLAVAASGPAVAQTTEAVDSTARGGVKAVIERLAAEEGARAAADAALDVRVTALESAGGGGGLTLLRTVVVSPVGTPVENGQALLAAVSDLAFAAPPPAAGDPYLIKIEPGVYDIGNNTLTIPAHVDVAGSGPGGTRIEATVGLGSAALFVVIMEADTELRELAIQFAPATATNQVDTGGITTLDEDVSIRNVRITGPGLTHEGVRALAGAAVRIRDVDIANVNIAVRQAGVGTVDFEGVRTDRVIVAETGTIVGRRSVVGQIDTGFVVTGAPAGLLTLATTQVLGANTSEPNTSTCVFSYDAFFTPLGPSC